MVPKTRKKERVTVRAELITYFRLLKSERARGRIGGTDRCQYRFICVWRGRPREEVKVCSGLPG